MKTVRQIEARLLNLEKLRVINQEEVDNGEKIKVGQFIMAIRLQRLAVTAAKIETLKWVLES